MASKKVVEVLCPNGRRQKVKADANSTILQVGLYALADWPCPRMARSRPRLLYDII